MVYGALAGGVLLSLIGTCGYFVTKYAESDPSKSKQYSSVVVAVVFIWSAQFGLTWCMSLFIVLSLSLVTKINSGAHHSRFLSQCARHSSIQQNFSQPSIELVVVLSVLSV
jgi:hypothetical protein